MKKIIPIVIVVILFFTGLGSYVDFYTDLLWFRSLDFEDAFWTMYTMEYLIGFLFFILTVLVFWLNYYFTKKAMPIGGNDFMKLAPPHFAKIMKLSSVGAVLFIAYHMASWAAGKWMVILQYLNAQPFGQTDPVFGHDISFFVFDLPFISWLINYIFTVLVLNIIIAVVIYIFRRGILFLPTGVQVGSYAKRHILALFSVIFALYIWDYYYSAFNILYNEQGAVFGAGYADIHASLIGYRVLSVIAALACILTIIGAVKAKWKHLIAGFIMMIGMAIVMLGIYPAIIQKFVVTPNALEKERPYILENILKTRAAFQLNKIQEKDFPYQQNLTANSLQANAATVKNITLWDYRPLKDSYSQLQEIRPYYMFNDIDIDRYTLNNEYRQVMLSARELNLNKISKGENWINQTFIYTHGHGVVMSPVNRVSKEGQPEFFIKNIPPESTVDVKFDRPEIYFGEMQAPDDYIIIKTSKEEFDYPIGETNQHTFYKEETGIDIGSFGRKLLYAIRFGKFSILLNDYIQDTSKIVYYRNIADRVKKITPYLKYDGDPYLAIADGRLFWIYDAFTTSGQYPYSKMYYEPSSDPFGGESFNYIRNSVKVVIDAYNGQTTFYMFNPEEDPLIRVYASIFKGVFKPISEMPASIKSHLRYPQDLFDIQAKLYSIYHVEDVNVFFNREDIWNIAEEKYGASTKQMESYYMIMRLPGEPKEEFMLMVPYTPNAKANMIAWLCVRSDGDNYGKLLVYRFPKSELIYGPNQIEARIDQTPDISEKLSLWNQQGSRVTRGNMLVVPINNSVVYVEPLYLQSEQSKMPELKKVIVAYANYIAMEDNLELALDKIFGGVIGSITEKTEDQAGEVKTAGIGETSQKILLQSLRSIKELTRSALDNYRRSQESVRSGNWSKYGEDLERLRKDLEKLSEVSKGL